MKVVHELHEFHKYNIDRNILSLIFVQMPRDSLLYSSCIVVVLWLYYGCIMVIIVVSFSMHLCTSLTNLSCVTIGRDRQGGNLCDKMIGNSMSKTLTAGFSRWLEITHIDPDFSR